MYSLEEGGTRVINPCILVIFGATGDLTSRKLIPALYNLLKDRQLPLDFACIGFARRAKTNGEFREEMKKAVSTYARVQPIEESLWNQFSDHLFYHQSEFHDDLGYQTLKTLLNKLDAQLGTKGNRVFYFATPPSYFTLITEKLHRSGLIYNFDEGKEDKWSRIIIEKPFGHDLSSAHQLQKELLAHLSEQQIFRIDHYLGKETVQNLLVFRFANSIFESLWNNRYIDQVQITVAESLGIGSRGKFFEEAGLLRDIVQNHMMQLLSLTAMEPPISLAADAIHNEKLKVLQSIRPFKPEEIVRGQYQQGTINGENCVAYRQEKEVSPSSSIETYVALKIHLDNWRWAGTPFYLRAGKRLPKRTTEIAVIFKDPPKVFFQCKEWGSESDSLVIRIQPDEGFSLKINCKVPGALTFIQPVKMDFQYGSYFGEAIPKDYEKLICDCILGDLTLFARQDEVFESWKLFTPVLEWWNEGRGEGPVPYAAGNWGPATADQMMKLEGHRWRQV